MKRTALESRLSSAPVMPHALVVRVGSPSTVKEMLPLLGPCLERPNACVIAANPFSARGVDGTKNLLAITVSTYRRAMRGCDRHDSRYGELRVE